MSSVRSPVAKDKVLLLLPWACQLFVVRRFSDGRCPPLFAGKKDPKKNGYQWVRSFPSRNAVRTSKAPKLKKNFSSPPLSPLFLSYYSGTQQIWAPFNQQVKDFSARDKDFYCLCDASKEGFFSTEDKTAAEKRRLPHSYPLWKKNTRSVSGVKRDETFFFLHMKKGEGQAPLFREYNSRK